MNERRLKRIEELYQQELAQLLLTQVDDPLLKGIRVTRVRVKPDLGSARIFYESEKGKEGEADALKGFKRCKGFLKKELSARVPLRFTPNLEFFYDEMLEVEMNLERAFLTLHEEKKKKGGL